MNFVPDRRQTVRGLFSLIGAGSSSACVTPQVLSTVEGAVLSTNGYTNLFILVGYNYPAGLPGISGVDGGRTIRFLKNILEKLRSDDRSVRRALEIQAVSNDADIEAAASDLPSFMPLLRPMVTPRTNVILYYFGHGLSSRDEGLILIDEKSQKTTLVDTLQPIIEMNPRALVAFFDCCRVSVDGQPPVAARPLTDNALRGIKSENIALIYSVLEGQPQPLITDDPKKIPLGTEFTNQFARFAGERIPITQLFAKISNNIPGDAHPQLSMTLSREVYLTGEPRKISPLSAPG